MKFATSFVQSIWRLVNKETRPVRMLMQICSASEKACKCTPFVNSGAGRLDLVADADFHSTIRSGCVIEQSHFSARFEGNFVSGRDERVCSSACTLGASTLWRALQPRSISSGFLQFFWVHFPQHCVSVDESASISFAYIFHSSCKEKCYIHCVCCLVKME